MRNRRPRYLAAALKHDLGRKMVFVAGPGAALPQGAIFRRSGLADQRGGTQELPDPGRHTRQSRGRIPQIAGLIRAGSALSRADATAGRKVTARHFPVAPKNDPLSGTSVLKGVVARNPDLLESGNARLDEISRARNVRSVFVVPMMLGDSAIGAISVSCKEPGLFLAAEGVIE